MNLNFKKKLQTLTDNTGIKDYQIECKQWLAYTLVGDCSAQTFPILDHSLLLDTLYNQTYSTYRITRV